MSTDFQAIADLLTPGARFIDRGLRVVAVANGLLIEKGEHVAAIATRGEIDDGSYKDTFARRAREFADSTKP